MKKKEKKKRRETLEAADLLSDTYVRSSITVDMFWYTISFLRGLISADFMRRNKEISRTLIKPKDSPSRRGERANRDRRE